MKRMLLAALTAVGMMTTSVVVAEPEPTEPVAPAAVSVDCRWLAAERAFKVARVDYRKAEDRLLGASVKLVPTGIGYGTEPTEREAPSLTETRRTMLRAEYRDAFTALLAADDERSRIRKEWLREDPAASRLDLKSYFGKDLTGLRSRCDDAAGA